MTRKEVQDFMAMIQGAYPNFNPPNKTVAVNSWKMALEDYEENVVHIAFKMYMKSDTSGFAPAPGQIIDNIHKLTEPQELNEMEAWSLVSRAIRNSGYNSVEEFAKLPPIVQKAVGLPSQLRRWALDEDYNEEVVSSNFIKCYRTELAREREMQKMPKAVLDMITKVNEKSYIGQIEQKRTNEVSGYIERREEEKRAIDIQNFVPAPKEYYTLMDFLKSKE